MLLLLLATSLSFARPHPIVVDPAWQALAAPASSSDAALRDTLRAAGEALGDWTIELAGVAVDGPYLTSLAAEAPDEPVTRVVRERFRQPIDLPDLLHFLDDVLVAGEAGRRGERFWVGSGRARSAGILLHPDDIYKETPRRYGRRPTLAVDRPQPQASYAPAADGALLGPEWTMRFVNPPTQEAQIAALAAARPGFAERLVSLTTQLEDQGASVWWNATVRHPERGYLMWGAFLLGRCADEACVDRQIAVLEDRRQAWKLSVDITWRHPDGWRATREAGRRMADAYDVVYATEKGARTSSHYGGEAADIAVVGLPRTLTLTAPDGARETFDLTRADEPRDLSLTPALVGWIEAHFGVAKLRTDYPHWSDAQP